MTPPARRCALILEPSLMRRQALKRLLRRHGFDTILEADSAHDALVLMRGQPVHLVLTPWAPPGLTGVPLLQALRQRPRDRPGPGGAPAIVLLDDGLAQPHVVAAVKAGIAGRLSLPAREAEFERILAALAEPGRPSSTRSPPRQA